eukprot:TRINITY_DN15180_c0_g1_i1.p2 TRINITY_DN15180_c0_g1~~TRINITY_DN15180_c0_g1_i1.p2  ORF type:complete len:216 (-),score=43.34 TRINITY_DN15180_c0_g1_i1:37-621(-)
MCIRDRVSTQSTWGKEQQKPKTGLFTEKPSAKLMSIKTADPFANQTALKKNSFAYVYSAGGIPCRINHGSVNNRLQWDQNVNLSILPYDPILVTCFEGLIEQQHPYNFIAKQAAIELLEFEDSADKVIPTLKKLIPPLRVALGSLQDSAFQAGLDVCKCLSLCVQDALNQHLNGFIGQLVKSCLLYTSPSPRDS